VNFAAGPYTVPVNTPDQRKPDSPPSRFPSSPKSR
jgi:hypothetical protein